MRYPDQVKGVSYGVLGANAGLLVVATLDARIGEQILAADAAGLRHGAIVLTNYIQAAQLAPLLAGTCLETWRLFAEPDWPVVLEHLAAAPCTPRDGPVVVPIDHHFDVKGVGAVVLGVVAQGTLRKGDTLYAWPDKVIAPVRSIQIHDVDHNEAHVGDRVGLALRNTKAEQLDRGMVLAPADAPLVVAKAGDEVTLQLVRSRFAKQPLGDGSVVHVAFGMQFVALRLVGEVPAAGSEGPVRGVVEKALVTWPGQAGVMWHMDSKQRVVGSLRAG